MRRLALITLASVAAFGAATFAAEPAMAASTTRLTLSVQAETGARKAVTLKCDPAKGTHPAAVAACADLLKAKGNPAAVPDSDDMCSMEWAPVTAKVTGLYKGKAVKYKEKFGNGCALSVGTGALFRF